MHCHDTRIHRVTSRRGPITGGAQLIFAARTRQPHVRRFSIAAFVVVLVAMAIEVTAAPAHADPVPPAPTPTTVSASMLPTWQINGVVWSQAIVGNTVYVTGSFTKARPPGV